MLYNKRCQKHHPNTGRTCSELSRMLHNAVACLQHALDLATLATLGKPRNRMYVQCLIDDSKLYDIFSTGHDKTT